MTDRIVIEGMVFQGTHGVLRARAAHARSRSRWTSSCAQPPARRPLRRPRPDRDYGRGLRRLPPDRRVHAVQPHRGARRGHRAGAPRGLPRGRGRRSGSASRRWTSAARSGPSGSRSGAPLGQPGTRTRRPDTRTARAMCGRARRPRRLQVARARPEGDVEGQLRPVPEDLEAHRVVRLELDEQRVERMLLVDLDAVDREDDVAVLDAGLRGRAAGRRSPEPPARRRRDVARRCPR